jgi:hypothetical protein
MSEGATRWETLRAPSVSPVPSRLRTPTWAVRARSYSSWNCGAPSSTTLLVVNITLPPGKNSGYT